MKRSLERAGRIAGLERAREIAEELKSKTRNGASTEDKGQRRMATRIISALDAEIADLRVDGYIATQRAFWTADPDDIADFDDVDYSDVIPRGTRGFEE